MEQWIPKRLQHPFALAMALVLYPALCQAIDVDLVWTSTTGSGTTGGGSITVAPGDVLEIDLEVTPDPIGLMAVSASISYDDSLLTATSATECPASTLNPLGSGVCGALPSPFLLPATTNGDVGSTAVSLGGADFDSDGKVGLPDYALFLSCSFSPPLNPPCDLDGSGTVNSVDYALFIQALGAPGVTGFPTGAVQMIEAQTIPDPKTGPFTLGRITFTATGTGTVTPSVTYVAGIDGFVEFDGEEYTFSVPDPSPGPPIPVLSPTGVIGFGVLLLGAMAVAIRRRSA